MTFYRSLPLESVQKNANEGITMHNIFDYTMIIVNIIILYVTN